MALTRRNLALLFLFFCPVLPVKATRLEITPVEIISLELLVVDFFASKWLLKVTSYFDRPSFLPTDNKNLLQLQKWNISHSIFEPATQLFPVRILQAERGSPLDERYPALMQLIRELEWKESQTKVIGELLLIIHNCENVAQALEDLAIQLNRTKALAGIKQLLIRLSTYHEILNYINELSFATINNLLNYALYSDNFIELLYSVLSTGEHPLQLLEILHQSPAIFNLFALELLPPQDQILSIVTQTLQEHLNLIALFNANPIEGLTYLVQITPSIWDLPGDLQDYDQQLVGLHQAAVQYFLLTQNQATHQGLGTSPEELAWTLVRILFHKPYLIAAISSYGQIAKTSCFPEFLLALSQLLQDRPGVDTVVGPPGTLIQRLLELCLNPTLVRLFNRITVSQANPERFFLSILSKPLLEPQNVILSPRNLHEFLQGLFYIIDPNATHQGKSQPNSFLIDCLVQQLSGIFPEISNHGQIAMNMALLLIQKQPALENATSPDEVFAMLTHFIENEQLSAAVVFNHCFPSIVETTCPPATTENPGTAEANQQPANQPSQNYQAILVNNLLSEALDTQSFDPEVLAETILITPLSPRIVRNTPCRVNRAAHDRTQEGKP